MPESLGTTQKKKFFVHSSKMSYAGVVGHDSTEEVLKNVTRISFIFRDYNLNSLASKLFPGCKIMFPSCNLTAKRCQKRANIQDSCGRLIGGYAGVVGHDSKEEVLKCNENLVHFRDYNEFPGSCKFMFPGCNLTANNVEQETAHIQDSSGRLMEDLLESWGTTQKKVF